MSKFFWEVWGCGVCGGVCVGGGGRDERHCAFSSSLKYYCTSCICCRWHSMYFCVGCLSVNPVNVSTKFSPRNQLLLIVWSCQYSTILKDCFVNVPSLWETALHCNIVSHWLGTYTKWSLNTYVFLCRFSQCEFTEWIRSVFPHKAR